MATDHWNLEEGLPTEVVDTTPAEYLEPEAHSVFRYEHFRNRGDRFVLQPRLEYGFARNWHTELTAPFLVGSAARRGSGNLEFEVFNKVSDELGVFPSLAMAAGTSLPTGTQSGGTDVLLQFIATKELAAELYRHRLHINLAWTHHSGGLSDDRRDRYTAILGYSGIVTPSTVLVLDVVREQEVENTLTVNIFEAGIRRMVSAHSVLAVGFGLGVGRELPESRITVGLEFQFD